MPVIRSGCMLGSWSGLPFMLYPQTVPHPSQYHGTTSVQKTRQYHDSTTQLQHRPQQYCKQHLSPARREEPAVSTA
eukprot:2270254-Rhodomonas_salina.1